jgi:hypothetical protein
MTSLSFLNASPKRLVRLRIPKRQNYWLLKSGPVLEVLSAYWVAERIRSLAQEVRQIVRRLRLNEKRERGGDTMIKDADKKIFPIIFREIFNGPTVSREDPM